MYHVYRLLYDVTVTTTILIILGLYALYLLFTFMMLEKAQHVNQIINFITLVYILIWCLFFVIDSDLVFYIFDFICDILCICAMINKFRTFSGTIRNVDIFALLFCFMYSINAGMSTFLVVGNKYFYNYTFFYPKEYNIVYAICIFGMIVFSTLYAIEITKYIRKN